MIKKTKQKEQDTQTIRKIISNGKKKKEKEQDKCRGTGQIRKK